MQSSFAKFQEQVNILRKYGDDDSSSWKEFVYNVYKVPFARIFRSKHVKHFQTLKSNEERFQYVFNLLPRVNPAANNANKKEESIALRYKDKAKRAFFNGDYVESQEMYSRAAIFQPCSTEIERQSLSIIVANRSAALYRRNLFQKCISDIEFAFELGYPADKASKLHKRKGFCLQNLGNHSDALLELKKSLQCLEDSPSGLDWWSTACKEILIALNRSYNAAKVNEQQDLANPTASASSAKTTQLLELPDPHPYLPGASSKLELVSSRTCGRYLRAAKPINPGDVLLVDRPYVQVLHPKLFSTHCLLCYKRVEIVIPCWTCTKVAFCSTECRDKAVWHHCYECSLTDCIEVGAADIIPFYIAVRLFTQTTWAHLMSLKQKLCNLDREAGVNRKYDVDTYECIYRLVDHFDKRPMGEILGVAIMAVYFIQCLRSVGYFQGCTDELSDDDLFAGMLMMHNLQVTNYNQSSLQYIDTSKSDADPAVFCSQILPMNALFNHSCDVKTLRIYNSESCVSFMALRGIEPGEVIGDDYGGVDFLLMARTDRQALLKGFFLFDCRCSACQKNYPTLLEMQGHNVNMKIRCTNKECRQPLRASVNDNPSKVVKCQSCRGVTKIKSVLHIMKEPLLLQHFYIFPGNISGISAVAINYIMNIECAFVPPYFFNYYRAVHTLRKVLTAAHGTAVRMK